MPLLVGEAPGAEEQASGDPFVGTAGKKLWMILEDLGISRDQVSLTNVLKCQPPGNDFDVAGANGISACLPAFKHDLLEARPPFVIALGARASKALVKPLKKTVPISQLRGHAFPSIHPELEGVMVFPTYHPSYLNYAKSDANVLDSMYQDLETAFGLTEKRETKTAFVRVDEDRKRYQTLVLDTESFIERDGVRGALRCTGYAPLEGEVKLTTKRPPVPTKKLICHFARHDYVELREAGLIPPDWEGEIEDTILLVQMLDENRDDYALKSFAKDFGYGFYWREVHGAWERKEDPPDEILHPYCADDVGLTRDVYLHFREKLEAFPKIKRNYEFLTKQIRLLGEVELNGIAIHQDSVKVLKGLKRRIRSREKWIRDTYGLSPEVKVSGKARTDILFNTLELPVLKKTKKTRAPKADKHVMAELARLDSTGTARRYRDLGELKAQDKDLTKLASAAGSLLHPKFNLGGRGQKDKSEGASPVTGRLSSQDPNMQNVPKWARVHVISRFKNGRILKADAKQVEIKAAYEYSKDEALIKGDAHKETMLFMNGLKVLVMKGKRNRLFKVDRQGGKTGNFAVIFGAEEQKLMEEYGIPYDAAKEIRRGLRDRFHVHFDWIDRLIRDAKLTGEVTSLSGHVRRLPMLKYGDKHAINQAVNHPIQNFANVLNLCSASHFGHRPKGALLINLVHDETVWDCESEDAALDLAGQIRHYWKEILPKDVKRYFGYTLTTEFGVETLMGENWGETQEIT